MSTKQSIRFISPEPRLALILHNRKRFLIPEEIHEYFINWISDVGATMRSREFMVSSVASYASSGIIAGLAKRLPKSGIISGLFGETKR